MMVNFLFNPVKTLKHNLHHVLRREGLVYVGKGGHGINETAYDQEEKLPHVTISHKKSSAVFIIIYTNRRSGDGTERSENITCLARSKSAILVWQIDDYKQGNLICN